MVPENISPESSSAKEDRRRIIIALLFLLLSFACVFCSSQTALWLIDRSIIQGSMLSTIRADYSANASMVLAPLNNDIIAEAAQDEVQLILKQTPLASGLDIVILPNPIPTAAPTVVALLPTPTPTFTPEPNPAPATPTNVIVPPTATSAPPTSTAPSGTATTLPPTATSPLATSTPPLVTPTPPLPTLPPSPTVMPPTPSATTVLPTGTSTTLPPTTTSTTVPPTSTGTAIPTQTSAPTATPIPPTPTDTPIPPTDTPIPPTDTPVPPTPTDTPIPPSVQFSAAAYSITEGNSGISLATITVTLSASPVTTVTVDYATSDGTSNNGSDYNSSSGTLIFAPGITVLTFDVQIIGDTLDEPDEVVRLTLSNQTVATLGTPSSAILTIEDDDTDPTCPGNYPPGEPNIGQPDGTFALIACNIGFIIDLGTTPIVSSGDPNPDFVYYEIQAYSLPPDPPPPPDHIYMDRVRIEVGPSPSGPWYQVFYWGDANSDLNTNIGSAGYIPPENDNELIPMTVLYGTLPLKTGITIDIDIAGVPAGSYQYIRITSPLGGDNDGPEVDAIEILP